MTPPFSSRTRRVLEVLAIVAVYFITARIGLMLALPPEKKATAVWPPSGVALATLVLIGYRVWPGIWLGALLANMWDYFDPTNSHPLTAHVFVSCGIATGSTIQALAGAFLIRRLLGRAVPFDRAADAFAFAGVALLMCLIAASFGVVSLYLGSFAPVSALGFIWWTWWLGDMTGVLTVGSLLLTWSRLPSIDWNPYRLGEAALLLLLLLVLSLSIFGISSNLVALPPPLAYLTVPFLVWAAFRFGLHGAATTLFLLSAVAVWGTSQGTGPFAQPNVQSSLLLLQVFMGVVAVTALVMAAVLNERIGAQAKVHQWEHISAHAGWPVAIVNPEDNTLQVVNQSFAAQHGYAVEELIGKPLAELLAPECRNELALHGHAIHEKGDYVYENIHVRKDGSRFPCLNHGTTFKDPQGRVVFRAGTFQDLTELKQAELVLRESEQRLSTLAAAVPGFLFTNLPNGLSDYTSRQYYDYTGLPEGSANGHGWAQAVHPDDRDPAMSLFKTCIQEKKPFDAQYRFRAADGNYRWFQGRSVPLLDEAGNIVRWFGICTDIDTQKRAEETLLRTHLELEDRIRERTLELRLAKEETERANRELVVANQRLQEESQERLRMMEIIRNRGEERFRQIVELAPNAMVMIDKQGTIHLVNAEAEKLFGYNRQELLGQPVELLVPFTIREKHPALREAFFAKPQTRSMGTGRDLFGQHKDGREVPIEIGLNPIITTEGVFVLASIINITERKRAEESQRLFQHELERKIRERTVELRQASDTAEAANRAKSDFLANMSHEIRTPMNGIIGMTELALDTDLTAGQREYLNAVKSSADSLLTIINDILDFSKIEAGKLDLDPLPFALRDSLVDLLHPLALRANAKHLKVLSHVRPDVPDNLCGDLGRLRQVIINLVSNAVKFTNRGEVVLNVGVEALTEETATLHVSVADTGIGIPAHKLSTIFNPFEQADGSMARKYGGTGLGLTISARLVEMMGGRIWAESIEGRGSTFHFTVQMSSTDRKREDDERYRKSGVAGCLTKPIKQSELLNAVMTSPAVSSDAGKVSAVVPIEPTAALPSGRQLLILLADDNTINQRVSHAMLEKVGHKVRIVNDGYEAVVALRQQTFDLVLMDVQMPVMDGLEATALIRESERATGRHTPIVALTAHAMKGDRERFLAAGMDGYLTKPLRKAELLQVIAECMNTPTDSAPLPSTKQSTKVFNHPEFLERLGAASS